jgi:DivIVA domain-containing protein
VGGLDVGQESGVVWRTPRGMAGSDESRAVYVVQRSFRRVRRGYDPDEVDRHLQLVSDWFTRSHAGEMARETEARLERERTELAGERLEADAILEGARLKAEAQTRAAERTRREAEAAAAEIVDRATREAEAQTRAAERTLGEAEAAAAEIVDRAKLEAEAAQVVADARVQAERLRERELATAREAAEQLLAAMRAQAAEEVAAMRAEAEKELLAYVERRHREADRLVDAARRERRRGAGPEEGAELS